MRSFFITFEGIDGVGKSLIIKSVQNWLKKKNQDSVCLFEPGSSSIGKPVCKLIFNNPKISFLTQAFLFMADRVQNLKEKIIPALQQKKIVLCDRYHDSTIAYQGLNEQEREILFGFYSNFFLKPDLTFLIDASEETIQKRMQERIKKNFFDEKNVEFRKQVKNNYLWLKRKENERVFYIENNCNPQQAIDKVIQIIQWKNEEQKTQQFQKILKNVISNNISKIDL